MEHENDINGYTHSQNCFGARMKTLNPNMSQSQQSPPISEYQEDIKKISPYMVKETLVELKWKVLESDIVLDELIKYEEAELRNSFVKIITYQDTTRREEPFKIMKGFYENIATVNAFFT